MAHSNRRESRGKPGRPKRPKNFPLYAHAVGYWAKKIRGKVRYFGSWRDDPQGERALALWLEQRDDLLAGREPKAKADSLTVADLVNHFLSSKQRLVTTGEIQQTTWDEYYLVCRDIVGHFGKRRRVADLAAGDFERLRAAFAEHVGPTRLGKLVQITRSVFRYGFENGLIEQPVRFGSGFSRPSKAVLRRQRAEKGPKLFTKQEIHCLLDHAGLAMRAMILLALNAGLGNTDLARLEQRHLDLAGGWLTMPRVKTGVPRRAKLWPETVSAIKAALAVRPRPKDKALSDRVFVTKAGNAWGDNGKGTGGPVALMFGRLVRACGIEKRPGRAFYALRHTYRTHADGCRDQPAVLMTMGHADATISDAYREAIDDSRLEAVAEYVHAWLFGGNEPENNRVSGPGGSHDSPAETDDQDGEFNLRLYAG